MAECSSAVFVLRHCRTKWAPWAVRVNATVRLSVAPGERSSMPALTMALPSVLTEFGARCSRVARSPDLAPGFSLTRLNSSSWATLSGMVGTLARAALRIARRSLATRSATSSGSADWAETLVMGLTFPVFAWMSLAGSGWSRLVRSSTLPGRRARPGVPPSCAARPGADPGPLPRRRGRCPARVPR